MPSSPPCAQATGTRCACSVVRGIVAMECLAKSMQLRDAVLWCFVFVYLKNRRWEYASALAGANGGSMRLRSRVEGESERECITNNSISRV